MSVQIETFIALVYGRFEMVSRGVIMDCFVGRAYPSYSLLPMPILGEILLNIFDNISRSSLIKPEIELVTDKNEIRTCIPFSNRYW